MKTKSIKMILAVILAVPVFTLSVSLSHPVVALATTSVPCPNGGTAASLTDCPSDLQSGADSAKGDSVKTCLFKNDKTGADACSSGIFTDIVNAALFLIGAISVIMIIYGGIRYTISGGDAKNVTAAKNTILYAIVGIIVAILAFAIVNFVITGLTPTS